MVHPIKRGGEILRKRDIWGGNSLGLLLLGHKSSDPSVLQSNVTVDTCYFLGLGSLLVWSFGQLPSSWFVLAITYPLHGRILSDIPKCYPFLVKCNKIGIMTFGFSIIL